MLRLRQANDPFLKAAVREALTLVGYVDPVKGRGIRILSIDGGGTRYAACHHQLTQNSSIRTNHSIKMCRALHFYGSLCVFVYGFTFRGLVALQTLQKLEEMSGKSIYQLFDYICGVSTGKITFSYISV